MTTQTQLQIPYIALAEETRKIKHELLSAVEKVISSGQYVLGSEVQRFEEAFAALCNTRYAIGVANGTSALTLVLRSLGLRENDEVITTSNSFIASASSIALAGGRPVFVDIGSDLNMDPGLLESKITQKTRAIMPVHLTGRPARMKEILEIARRHDLFVLEDSAQSVGAERDDRRVGSWGHAACFSLHPLKHLHCFGDGGVITTNDSKLKDTLVKARNHGLRNRDECEFWSENSRLDEIQAAILNVQLKHFPRWIEERRTLAQRYNQHLGAYVDVPNEGPGERCMWQTYVIQADRRDQLLQRLRSQGVQAMVHYPIPIHLQPVMKGLGYTEGDLPVTKRASDRIMSLPLYPQLTETQQDHVINIISEFYNECSNT